MSDIRRPKMMAFGCNVRVGFTFVFLAELFTCAATLPAAAPLGDLAQIEQLQTTLAQVADAVSPTVVAIRAEREIPPAQLDVPDGPGGGLSTGPSRPPRGGQLVPAIGTGIIVESAGAILTNEHVVHGAEPDHISCILSTGEVYKVKTINSDPRSDLAILRVDARNLPQVRFGDAANVKQGHFAIVMGNPLGSASDSGGKPAMSFGVISALGRPLTRQLDPLDERYYGNLIQTDARISPGSSGGPLLNIRGEVIGITTAVATRSGGDEGLGYAIPIDQRTLSIVAQLLRGEEVEYGFLGVRLDEPTPNDRRQAGAPPGLGVLIRDVEKNTPAEQARLKPGDVVVEFDGTAVHDVDQLVRMVGATRVGTLVGLTFYRDHAKTVVSVSPARREVPVGANHRTGPTVWRGLTVGDLTPELRKKWAIAEDVGGVAILSVETDAAKRLRPDGRQKLHGGMVIREVNGAVVGNLRAFRTIAADLHGEARLLLADENRAVEASLSAPAP